MPAGLPRVARAATGALPSRRSGTTVRAEDAVPRAREAPWRPVAEAARDARSPESLRRALDGVLADRVAALTQGERIALARIAEPRTRAVLAETRDARVLGALLTNPRLTTREAALCRAGRAELGAGREEPS